MPPHRIKAVFFDLDGTLIQTAQSFEATLKKMGLNPPPFDFTADFLAGVDWRAAVEYVFRANQTIIPQILQDFESSYAEHLEELTIPYPYCAEVFEQLRYEKYFIGVVSNKPDALCHEVLAFLGLSCDVVLGSGKIGFKKPHPAPLYYSLRDLPLCPWEVLYIGDMPSDLEAARWSGFRGVYARYGLHHRFNPLFKFRYFIDSLREIFPLIDSFAP